MSNRPQELTRVIGDSATGVEEELRKLGRRELQVLAPYIARYKWWFAGAALALIISQVMQLASPFLLRMAIDDGIQQGNVRMLNIVGFVLIGTTITFYVMLRTAMLLGGLAGERSLQAIRAGVFEHLASLDLAFFEREKTGKLVSRLTADVQTIQMFVTEAFIQMAAAGAFLLGSMTVLFIIDAWLALACVLVVVPASVRATIRFRSKAEPAYLTVRDRIAAVLSFMQETVRGIHVVQAFGRERVNRSQFRQVNEEWRQANIYSFGLGARFFPVVEFIGLLGSVVVLVYGGWRVVQGDLTVGVLAAFVLYLGNTLEPIQFLSQLFDMFQQAMSGLAKLANLLEERPQITNDSRPSPFPAERAGATFGDVSFRYRDDLPPALVDVDLELRPGQTLALVGPTGAGKSSIAKLILRFYDPSDGSILVGGDDLRKIQLESLREHTAIVPQEGFLFRGTLRNNIRFGRPDATDEEVEWASRLVGIEEIAAKLPDGLDTEVQERGAAFSEGQKQLVALARALLADPRLLVLDEATSSLDGGTETRIQEALAETTKGRTTLIIAHRLSTVEHADLIAVVDYGQVLEIGTHDELMAKEDSVYSALYHIWLAGST